MVLAEVEVWCAPSYCAHGAVIRKAIGPLPWRRLDEPPGFPFRGRGGGGSDGGARDRPARRNVAGRIPGHRTFRLDTTKLEALEREVDS